MGSSVSAQQQHRGDQKKGINIGFESFKSKPRGCLACCIGNISNISVQHIFREKESVLDTRQTHKDPKYP